MDRDDGGTAMPAGPGVVMRLLATAIACGLGILILAQPARAQCWSETAQVKMTKGDSNDDFGYAVSVQGDTAIVGVRLDSNFTGVGSVLLFERDLGGPGAWGKVTKRVVGSGGGGQLGTSVSIEGDTAVGGAPLSGMGGVGTACIWERDFGGPEAWGQTAQLDPSDGVPADWFGQGVALSGDTLVVGAPRHDSFGVSSGAAYVFERNLGGPEAWGEARQLVASDGSPHAWFGAPCAIQGDTIVVAAANENGTVGAVYVFERDLGGLGAWGERAKLTASDGAPGDSFGGSVSLFGDTLVVGAPWDGDNGWRSGSAYVFERDLGGPNAWGERTKLLPTGGQAADYFGASVSIFGDTAIVGAYSFITPAGDTGTVFVYERQLGGPQAWGELTRLLSSNIALFDGFGKAVSISAETLLVGSPGDNSPGFNFGAAYVFEQGASASRYCTAGTSGSGCRAFLTVCGAPSATAPSGFVVTATNVEGSSNGLFYYGASGRQANPWGNGTSLQCVAPPVRRGGLLTGVGTQGACDGSFSQDLNARWCPTCPKPNHNPGAGTLLRLQLWYRDRFSTSNQTTSLSDALEVATAP